MILTEFNSNRPDETAQAQRAGRGVASQRGLSEWLEASRIQGTGRSNTPLNRQRFTETLEAGIDTVSTLHSFDSSQQMRNFLARLISHCEGDRYVILPGQKWANGSFEIWENSIASCFGLRGGYHSNPDRTIGCRIYLSGEFLRRCGSENQFRILQFLSLHNAEISRIDAFINDLSKGRRTPWQVYRDANPGAGSGKNKISQGYGAGFEKAEWCFSDGGSAYLGSRKSDAYLRVYDSEPKHGYAATRWEMQLRRKHAKVFFDAIANLYQAPIESDDDFNNRIAQSIANLVLGRVAFYKEDREVRARSGFHNSRYEYKRWFASLVKRCGGRYRLALPQYKPTLWRNKEWFRTQIASSLALWRDGLGAIAFHGWLNELIDDGRQKITKQKAEFIQVLRDGYL